MQNSLKTQVIISNCIPILAVLIWAVNVVVTKYSVTLVTPLTISIMRWVAAFVILTPFVMLDCIRHWQQIRPLLAKLAVLGILGMLCFQGTAYFAVQFTSAINLGVIGALSPMFTMLLAYIFLGQKLNWFLVIGVLVSFLGVLIFLAQGNPLRLFQQGFNLGDGCILLATILYALYGILLRLWSIPLKLILSLYWQIFFAILFQLPLLLIFDFTSFTSQNTWLFLFTGIMPSIVAPLLWLKAIQLNGPTKTTLTFNLIPIFVSVLAVVFLNEYWNSYNLLGMVLVFIGLFIVQKK